MCIMLRIYAIFDIKNSFTRIHTIFTLIYIIYLHIIVNFVFIYEYFALTNKQGNYPTQVTILYTYPKYYETQNLQSQSIAPLFHEKWIKPIKKRELILYNILNN